MFLPSTLSPFRTDHFVYYFLSYVPSPCPIFLMLLAHIAMTSHFCCAVTFVSYSSADSGVLDNFHQIEMSPDLIPNKSNRFKSFLVWALLVILDHFCTALLAAVQYGTLVPHLSPWLFLAMLPFCAPKSVWGCVLIPYYPCHGNVFLDLLVSMTVILGTTH